MIASQSGILIPAATAITTTVSLTDIGAARIALALSTTVASGGNTVQVTINGITASGYSYTILTGVAVAAVAVTLYRIGVGLTASANLTANDAVPRSLSIVATVAGTVAYGVDYFLG